MTRSVAVDIPVDSVGLGWFVCLCSLSMTEDMRLNICHHTRSHQEVSGRGSALCVNNPPCAQIS